MSDYPASEAARRSLDLERISSVHMTPEELLTTTRSVRRRLDLTRNVPRDLLVECVETASQAPTGSNRQQWHWLIVTDPDKRSFIGECYRKSWYAYAVGSRPTFEPEDPRAERQERVQTSARFLADHMGEVPALVIACIEGRAEGRDNLAMAGLYGSILPAAWSFMLAARLRGLGSAYTTLHLAYEREVAERLGLPFERITQAALLPVAYFTGEDFLRAARIPLEDILHWDEW
ncbi:MAG TPA: nitroreductase family protein [Solirubrobacteraceae bacterium]